MSVVLELPEVMTRLGPLEVRMLELVWDRTSAVCVRDLAGEFPALAYTTLMTTMDRLYHKGLLSRERQGRSFYYRAAISRMRFMHARAESAFERALASVDTNSAEKFLQVIVDTIAAHNPALLTDVQQLIAERRQVSD
jgi:predicted transcriptional regulator